MMRGRSVMALAAVVVIALLAVAALRDLARLGPGAPWRQLYDFADFYCAGEALDRHFDPYRYEPLHRCEHTVNQSEAYRSDPARAVPAPLPPYDFPPLMVLARLSYANARTLDALAIVAATVLCIALLATLDIPLELAAAALIFPAGYVLLAAGQVVPFAFAALVGCGVALRRRHDMLAGALAALTLVEPHLGLPVWLATLVWLPRCRLAAATTAAALGCIGVAVVGAAASVEYVTRVLPAQAAAEHAYAYQYSFTYLLATLGMPPTWALLLGDASYAVMLAVAVWASGRVAAKLRRPEMFAFVPAACSVIGGPYVHMVDLTLAIPAALVLATALSGRAKATATVALALLTIPWIPVWITKKLFLATLFVATVLLWRVQVARAAFIASVATIALALYLIELFPPAPLA
ncbi:MAG: hypothetical protein JO263_04400, partial [Candidatus Eremiobacteraeota bacterium]|nr:hypothetical protein [Candidatus Eremiobacteraeota bacterium]